MPKPVVLVDAREYKARAKIGEMAVKGTPEVSMPIVIPGTWKTKKVTLQTGDYTIEGLRHVVCVERKAVPDLFKTLTWKEAKGRFMEELQRSRQVSHFTLFIQGTVQDVLSYDGRWRGRSNNGGLLNYVFELSRAYQFDVVFSSTSAVVAGRTLSSLLMSYLKMKERGEIRVRRGFRFNV